tara:strand:- start:1517 stop:2086 length:570 start_codon:yes stop_codon:yes gene_type:complete
LTNAELFALLFGSGNPGETAVQIIQRLMASLDHDLSALHRISLYALLQWKGIGPAKAVKIKAIMELGKRIQGIPSQEKVSCTSSAIAYDTLFAVLSYLDQEEFWILLLNIQHHVVEKKCLSKGGISEATVDIRLLLKSALQCGATAIIVAHNHPSGVLKPSTSDIQLIQKIKKAGEKYGYKTPRPFNYF